MRPAVILESTLNALGSPRFEEGACAQADPELFFPVRAQSAARAKKLCAGCVVREQCLEYALANGEQGIWGGTSERQRRQIRAERRASAGRA